MPSLRRIVTVETILFVYQFAKFMSTPLIQQLVNSKVCEEKNCSSDNHANTSVHSSCINSTSLVQKAVEDETSRWLLYINLANSIPAIVAALAFGAWSDKTGRRLVLCLPAVGIALNAAVVLIVWYRNLPVSYLLIGQIGSSFLGGYATFLMATFAYMADITTHENRTLRIGILESMTYLGGCMGNLIGGLWIKSGNYAPAFWCIVAAGIFIVLYTILYLPETRTERETTSLCRSLFCSCDSLITSARLFWDKDRSRLFYPLILGVTIFALLSINFAGMIDVIVLFAYDFPLCWASDTLGYFFAFKLAMYGVAALVILPVAKRHFHVEDFPIIYAGLISGASGLIVLGFSSHTWMMMYLGKVTSLASTSSNNLLFPAVPIVTMLRGLVVPCLRSLMSQMVGEDNQGKLKYASGALVSLLSPRSSVFGSCVRGGGLWTTCHSHL